MYTWHLTCPHTVHRQVAAGRGGPRQPPGVRSMRADRERRAAPHLATQTRTPTETYRGEQGDIQSLRRERFWKVSLGIEKVAVIIWYADALHCTNDSCHVDVSLKVFGLVDSIKLKTELVNYSCLLYYTAAQYSVVSCRVVVLLG